MKKLLGILFVIIGLYSNAHAQLVKADGYLKELGTLSFDNNLGTLHYDNLIHNRVNTHWKFKPNWTAEADIRTRIFNGFSVENIPQFGKTIGKDNGLVSLSWNIIDSHNLVMNTQIDRLYTTYYTNKWELDVGRQRINWGRTLVWNPNDLFNTYSYLDFDYEERPGADAIRFQYFTGFASGYEVAFKPARDMKQSVAAFLAREHFGQYDFQGLAGYYRDMLALGGGWAGPIGQAGFKGEFTYFNPLWKSYHGSGYLLASTSIDYSFSNSLYLYGEFLFNGNWHKQTNPAYILTSTLSANNLFVSRTAMFLEASYPVTPLVTLMMSGIFSTSSHLNIIIPQVTISLSNNLDFLLLAQVLRNQAIEQVIGTPNILYARLKYSF